MAARRRRQKKKGAMPTPLRLTSMMDILTVLLLFLLKSFVVEGEVIMPAPGVDLPESSSDTPPRASLVVAIFDGAVLVDGQMVARMNEAQATAGGDLLIPELAVRLEKARGQEREIARLRGEEVDAEPKLAIQGDRDIPFALLQRVMYTCNRSGYADISLAVIGAS